MSSPNQLLCDKCHQRPATCHICYAHTGEKKDLCENCYAEIASPEELASSRHVRDSIQRGKCSYCGEPAVGGSGGIMPLLGEQLHLWCEQCRQDLVEFAQRPENAVPKEFPVADQAGMKRLAQQFADRERRQEEFMKQRLLERKSKGNG